MVALKIGGIHLAAAYWSPNKLVDRHMHKLQQIINTHRGPWIVAEDLNVGLEPVVDRSKLPWPKRERLSKAQIMVHAFDLWVYNDSSPTCLHLGTESINDYTLGWNVTLFDWKVDNGVTMSDHQYIWFQFIPREKAAIERHILLATDENKFNELILLALILEEVTGIKELNHNVALITES